MAVGLSKTYTAQDYSSNPGSTFTPSPTSVDVSIGTIFAVGGTFGVSDLSGTGGKCASPYTISFGSSKYLGLNIVPHLVQDTSKSIFNPLRYIDAFSVGLGFGLNYFDSPVSVTRSTGATLP